MGRVHHYCEHLEFFYRRGESTSSPPTPAMSNTTKALSTNWTFPRRHRPLSSPTSRNTPAPISPSIHGFSPSQFVKTQFLSFSSRAAFPFFCRFALNVRIHSLLRSLPSAAVATHCWQATSQLAGHCFLLQTAAATEGAMAAAVTATTKRAP